jgi:hypothetical protein
MTYRIRLRPHVVGAFLFVGLLISLCLVIAFAIPARNAHVAHFAGQGSAGDAHGFTARWYEGETVQFFYTREFFCEPPSSGAPSQCEVGEDGQTDPRPDRNIPTLFVMTSLGFRPDTSTLHCPLVGNCINHPSTTDLSRIGGSSDALLRAHSHAFIDAGNRPTRIGCSNQ